MHADVVYN